MTNVQKDFINALMHNHYLNMVNFAYRRTNDKMIAQELVQDAFLVVCAKIDYVFTHENPAGFLYSSLKYLIMRERDKAYRRHEIQLDPEKWALIGYSDDLLSIEQALPHGLSDAERELILYRVRDGLSNSEIAARLNVPEVNIRQRMSRAMRKCKELLEKENFEKV